MANTTGIIGAVTGCLALAWNIAQWCVAQYHQTRVVGTSDEWYVQSSDATQFWVHCIARFGVRGSVGGSIVRTDLEVVEPRRITGLAISASPNIRGALPAGNEVGVNTSRHPGTVHLGGNNEVIEVGPCAPEDRTVYAVGRVKLEHEFRPIRIRLACVDDHGHRSCCTFEARHLASDGRTAQPTALRP